MLPWRALPFVVTAALCAPAAAAPDLRDYPTRDLKADRRTRTQVGGQAVEVQTLVTRDDPARVAVWYLTALAEAGWVRVGDEAGRPPELERLDGDTLRIRAHAPLKDVETFDGWFALADGTPGAPPLVVVEVSRPAAANVTTVRVVRPLELRPLDLRPGQAAARAPPGMLTCADCTLETVIRQPGAVVAVYTGPGGTATGVERLRAGAARGGWEPTTSDRSLPQSGAHTLGFQRGGRACVATVTPGPSSWRFRAGVVCETP